MNERIYEEKYNHLLNVIHNMLKELKKRKNKTEQVAYWCKMAMLRKILKENDKIDEETIIHYRDYVTDANNIEVLKYDEEKEIMKIKTKHNTYISFNKVKREDYFKIWKILLRKDKYPEE